MKVWIWGAGFASKELVENELKDKKIEGIIDRNLNRAKSLAEKFGGAGITPEEACREEYDLIIVATAYSHEIYKQALELGYNLNRFLFVYNNYKYADMNTKNSYELASQIFENSYVNVIKNRYHVIRGMELDETTLAIFEDDTARNAGMYCDDYTRIRTFELIANEIKDYNVLGNVAEFGVYRGEFARYINEAFFSRTLYLFDTFEGFRDEEAMKEKASGNCGDAFIDRFKDTSLDRVLNLMPHPEKIKCYKGLFPESLNGLEDNFAFVSIDVDFEQAIYDGIEYFYPRLAEGGYMFIHDYNSKTLKGVRKAVLQYEKKYHVRLNKVPISDLNGTLVITK